MALFQKGYLGFTGGVEQGDSKTLMTEMTSLLGPLISVGSSEPSTFAAKQNVGEEILLNLYWGKKQVRKPVRKGITFCKTLTQISFQWKWFWLGSFWQALTVTALQKQCRGWGAKSALFNECCLPPANLLNEHISFCTKHSNISRRTRSFLTPRQCQPSPQYDEIPCVPAVKE